MFWGAKCSFFKHWWHFASYMLFEYRCSLCFEMRDAAGYPHTSVSKSICSGQAHFMLEKENPHLPNSTKVGGLQDSVWALPIEPQTCIFWFIKTCEPITRISPVEHVDTLKAKVAVRYQFCSFCWRNTSNYFKLKWQHPPPQYGAIFICCRCAFSKNCLCWFSHCGHSRAAFNGRDMGESFHQLSPSVLFLQYPKLEKRGTKHPTVDSCVW